MMWVLLVASALGAMLRLVLDRLMPPRSASSTKAWHGWPWGILLANLAGTFVLGLVLGYARSHELVLTPALFNSAISKADELWIVAAGFCGSLTTVSTLFVGFHGLYVSKPRRGVAYLLGTLGLAGLAGCAGFMLTS